MNDLSGPLRDPMLRRRLRLLAHAVRALIVLGIAGFVGVEAWYWSTPTLASSLLRGFTSGPIRVGAQVQVLGALCTLLPGAVLVAALRRLWQVFSEYAEGRVFSHRALVSLRGFAWWLLVDTAVSPVYGALLSVLATWENGPGRRQLQVNFGSDDYVTLMFGLVVLAISTVMVEAARVAEDNEGFV